MKIRLTDENIADYLVYGLDVRKMSKNLKSSRKCNIYLYPLDLSRLCWVSKKKSPKRASICIENATYTIISSKMDFIKKNWDEKFFIEINESKRKLVIGLERESDLKTLYNFFNRNKHYKFSKSVLTSIEMFDSQYNTFFKKKDSTYLQSLGLKNLTQIKIKNLKKQILEIRKEELHNYYANKEDCLQSIVLSCLPLKEFYGLEEYDTEIYRTFKTQQIEDVSYSNVKNLAEEFQVRQPKTNSKEKILLTTCEGLNLFIYSRKNSIKKNYKEIKKRHNKLSKRSQISSKRNCNMLKIYDCLFKSSAMISYFNDECFTLDIIKTKILILLENFQIRLFEMRMILVIFILNKEPSR